MSNILVVDDDPDLVEVVKAILESDGYQVSSAGNSSEALAMIHQERPDLVLLDIMMTDILDGLNVSREMYKDRDLRGIPIIIVSSITQTPEVGEFPTDKYLHVRDWVSKPIRPDLLLGKVRLYLQRSS